MYSRDMIEADFENLDRNSGTWEWLLKHWKYQWNRNGGDCTMDNNLKWLRSNSTIVVQNIIGKMQLGRRTFRIKNY